MAQAVPNNEVLKLDLRQMITAAIILSLILIFLVCCNIIYRAWLAYTPEFSGFLRSEPVARRLFGGFYEGAFYLLGAFIYFSFFLIAKRHNKGFLRKMSLVFTGFYLYLLLDLILIYPVLDYLSVNTLPYLSTLSVLSVAVSIMFGAALIKLSDLSNYAFFSGLLIIVSAAVYATLPSLVFTLFILIAQVLFLIEVGLGRKIEL